MIESCSLENEKKNKKIAKSLKSKKIKTKTIIKSNQVNKKSSKSLKIKKKKIKLKNLKKKKN